MYFFMSRNIISPAHNVLAYSFVCISRPSALFLTIIILTYLTLLTSTQYNYIRTIQVRRYNLLVCCTLFDVTDVRFQNRIVLEKYDSRYYWRLFFDCNLVFYTLKRIYNVKFPTKLTPRKKSRKPYKEYVYIIWSRLYNSEQISLITFELGQNIYLKEIFSPYSCKNDVRSK